jgi:23S rRNA (guanine2445-N2)-methyltransferase / 23S rRNA (guanine2069-N7)-methyltransferase
MLKYFATCPKGLESLLRTELTNLGASDVKETVAGVSFVGDMSIGLKACLWSRFATRVLLSLATYRADSDIEFYMGAYNIRYEAYFDFNATIAVDFNGQNEYIRNTQYGALRIKDAICDRFVKNSGFRPNVEKENPDVRVNVHLDRRNNVTISLDLSGKPLHQRDYRTEQGIAPLKENLAAAIVAKSGYHGGNVIDPMCGSGTLIIEAAMQAAGIAPGLFRHQFGFFKLKMYDASEFAAIKQQAINAATAGKSRLRDAGVRFIGFDMDASVIEKAKENITRAGLDSIVFVECSDLKNLKNPLVGKNSGLIVCNPPYGERLGNFAELLEVYTLLGSKIRNEFQGWRAGVISSSADLLSCLRLRYENRYKLYNGALECQLRTFVISDRSKIEDSNADLVDGKQATSTEESAQASDSLSDNKVSSTAVSMEQALKVAPEFANRLLKNIKHLDKWAKREGLEAYRIYDADLPNYAAAIDRYADYIVVQEYAAPKTIPVNVAKQRLLDMLQVIVAVTGVAGDHVILKVRERKRGDEQYEKIDESKHTLIIEEYGIGFVVNLWDYLDTGLFLDHRLTRKLIGQMSKGKDFLNIFAYTGSASVYAAVGGATTTTTVDMSRTYLNWAKDNMKANGIKFANHRFEQADCLRWLDTETNTYDLIFVDPPTFSNSKRMEETFDVQRDHVALLTKIYARLRPNGVIIFSNNNRNFAMNVEAINALGLKTENISAKTLPQDFKRNSKIHNCWLLTRSAE